MSNGHSSTEVLIPGLQGRKSNATILGSAKKGADAAEHRDIY